MKLCLVLFRHGDAEPERGAGDHARNLSPKGLKQAAKTVKTLAGMVSGKTFFLVSTATRTMQTFSQCKAHFKNFQHAEFESLYLAGLDKIEQAIAQIKPDPLVANLIVIGHNPGLSAALATLAEDLSGLGTADAAVLEIEADSWSAALAMAGCWKLTSIVPGS